MEIYRIEHKDGRGVYAADGLSDRVSDRHPGPYSDRGLKDKVRLEAWLNRNYGDALFGFANVKQMRDWVGDERLEYLDRNGFVVRIYVAPPQATLRGSKQVMFLRKSAKLIREAIPSEFFGEGYKPYHGDYGSIAA